MDICVVPATVQILLNATCVGLGPLASSSIDLAGMAGEQENVQLLLRSPPAAPPTTLSSVASTVKQVTTRQVGYVNTATTTRYSPSGGGWRPDPLLELDPQGTLLAPGVATPLWLSFTLPAAPTTGKVELTFTDGTQTSVQVQLTVWPGLTLPPPLELHRDFGEIWSWDVGDVQTLYGPSFTNATAMAFRELNSAALLPPDNLYKKAPYEDLAVYDYLRDSGVRFTRETSLLCTLSEPRRASSRADGSATDACGGPRWWQAYLLNLAALGSDARGCPQPYSEQQVKQKLASIAAAVEAIGAGPDARPYVYGYDEQPRSCEPNIRTLFGAVKARGHPLVLRSRCRRGPRHPIPAPRP